MKVTGSIVTYNSGDDIKKCISSILRYTEDIDFSLYVSDNCSTDDTVDIVRGSFPEVKLLQNEKNGGFGYGHNKVISRVKSDYHVVINPDIELRENTIKKLCDYLEEHPDVGMVSPKTLNPDGSEQFLPKTDPSFAYVVISKFPGMKHLRRRYTRQDERFDAPAEVESCSGCFFVARTKALKELRGFDRRFYMYFEDADISRRMRAKGYRLIFHPETSVVHDWHRDNTRSLRGIRIFLNSMIKYFGKWRKDRK